MQYKVICGGILKANGELAPYDTILEEIELDDASMRVKEGYVVEVKGGKAQPAAKASGIPGDNTAAINAAVEAALVQSAIDKQAEIDAAVKKALDDKQAEIDAGNNPGGEGVTLSAAELLAAAKNK